MKPPHKRRKGQLTAEDRELWSKVTKTLTPLHPRRPSPPDPETFAEALVQREPKAGKAAKTETAMRHPVPTPKSPAPPPLHHLEHRYRKKLVRGVKPIDARIDLHGLTQHQAHDRLRGFLHRAQSQGHKLVLVITGKGGARDDRGFMDERGVLRRVVPQWLALPDLRPVVIGYEEAHVTHGGSGALYVRIRRRR